MTRSDDTRQRLTKPAERIVTRDPWVTTAAERQWMREQHARVVQTERSTWPLVLAALLLVLLACAIENAPAVRAALADIPWAKLFNYAPVSPIDRGDRNGLLHK